MRLVSQDGMIDVNYDNGSLVVGVGKYEECISVIISYYDHSCQKGTKLAEYSSKAKAIKVMEMVREQYQYGKKIAVPELEENGIAKDDNVMLFNTRLINDFFKGGTYLPVKVFQFPSDEEVEV
jgi:hypothetical protein